MPDPEELIPLHGGYGKLKSFRVAQLVHDVSVRFCGRHTEKRSPTHGKEIGPGELAADIGAPPICQAQAGDSGKIDGWVEAGSGWQQA